MTSDVQRFAESFRDEAELRERLATLFSKFPNIQGIQVPHGTQEYGKDIIFYSQDAIGDWVLNACVVKNDKITGAAEGNTAARNVFNQVEQALDTPFVNTSGEDETVAHVYVVSPYDCPQTTLRSIQGKLKARSGQVTFLCGRLLLEKFAKFWPEFVAFETTLMGSYIARLERNFDETDPIAFLMSQNQVLSAGSKGLAKVYVRQRFRKLLQEFDLTVQAPNPALLGGDVSDATVAEFTQGLAKAAALLRYPEAWDLSKVRDGEPTSTELLTLGEQIRANWNAESERFRSDRQRRGLRVPPKDEVRVPINIDPGPVDALIGRVAEALNALDNRLEQANTFARGCRDLLGELGSASHLSY